MNYFILFSAIVLASSVCAIPLRKDLTLAEFRSLRDEETPSAKVFITPSYAQVRRQGRNFGGNDVFSFKRPLTVRNPLEFAAVGRTFNPPSKQINRVAAAPVFDLNVMLRKEAAKLKEKVQKASLAAAKAAEEAERKLEEMVEKVMDETDATRQEVENIIEEAVETGIEEAEKMIEDELVESSGDSSEVEVEIFGEEKTDKLKEMSEMEKAENKNEEELAKELINIINDNDEPSRDIDLGSVQEV